MSEENNHSLPEVPDFPADTPAEDLLKIVGDEMRKPIIAIEGITILLLQMEIKKEEHSELLEYIKGNTAYLKAILDKVEMYVGERRKLRNQPNEKE